MINTENFYCKLESDSELKGFRVAIRDREVKDEERWVFAWLDEEEAKKLYNYLKQTLN